VTGIISLLLFLLFRLSLEFGHLLRHHHDDGWCVGGG
jgi:hypothetical protein